MITTTVEEDEAKVKSIINAQPKTDFVKTPYVENVIKRALAYIEAGYPVHFRGPAGTGKTTLAMHVAYLLGRPVALTHGNADLSPTDLIGGLLGYRETRLVDNYIHNVSKAQTAKYLHWLDGCVTEAVRHGYTLVYDEFTRSKPETNNVLLSILEEKILEMPTVTEGERLIKAHPDFAAIFTSNPEEYAGVYKSQDALRDRMITIDLNFFDEETEVAITQSKSGLSHENAQRIVRIVREFRATGNYEFAPTVRSSIMIAKVLQVHRSQPVKENLFFQEVALDVLVSETNRVDLKGDKRNEVNKIIIGLIGTYC